MHLVKLQHSNLPRNLGLFKTFKRVGLKLATNFSSGATLVEINQNISIPFTTCNYLRLNLGIFATTNQISTILVIFTTMMQLLEFSYYWLDRFYIYFHPLIG
jgi:hypothetical protein